MFRRLMFSPRLERSCRRLYGAPHSESDINIVGKINLFPSETGTLEMVAAGAINGLNP